MAPIWHPVAARDLQVGMTLMQHEWRYPATVVSLRVPSFPPDTVQVWFSQVPGDLDWVSSSHIYQVSSIVSAGEVSL